MKRSIFVPLLLLSAVVVLSACSGGQPVVNATATAAPVPQATPALNATPAAPTSALPPAASTSGPVGTSEATAEAQLLGTPPPTVIVTADLPVLRPSALSSYVANIEFRNEIIGPITGTVTPQPTESVDLRYNSQPAPGVYTWSMAGGSTASGAPQSSKLIQAGQDTYVFVPEQNKWLKMPVQSGQQMPTLGDVLDPNKLAQQSPPGLFSKENIVNRNEDINGVATTHYRATDTQVTQLFQNTGDPNTSLVSGKADFWVSNDNGYLKQYELVVNLKDKQGREYRQTSKMVLSNENKPVDIATPAPDQILSMDQFQQGMATAAVQGGSATSAAAADLLKTLPAPPQGKAVTENDLPAGVATLARNTLGNLGGVALYSSTADRAVIRKFYQDQLAGQGWNQMQDNPSTDAQVPDQMIFGKGSSTLVIFILQDPAGKQNFVLAAVE